MAAAPTKRQCSHQLEACDYPPMVHAIDIEFNSSSYMYVRAVFTVEPHQ
jgi:hypothetical protein